MDNKPNNLPTEGWVLKMEHDHPRKDEVMEWLKEYYWSRLTGNATFYRFHPERSFDWGIMDDYESHLPRLSMDEFISRTIDFEKEPEVGEENNVVWVDWKPEPSEVVEVSSNGRRWVRRWYVGTQRNGLHVVESEKGRSSYWEFIRKFQPLTLSLSEAEKRLSEIENRVVKIEG